MNSIAKKGIFACELVALAAVLGFAAAAEKTAASPDGAALYKKNCASCHAKDAKGNPVMSKMFKLDATALDLKSKAAAGKTDEALAKIVSEGSGKMPGYKKSLSPAEIKALVAFFHAAPAKAGAKAAAPATMAQPAPQQPKAPAAQ
jgi:mono/diheme cytochrome c family protein